MEAPGGVGTPEKLRTAKYRVRLIEDKLAWQKLFLVKDAKAIVGPSTHASVEGPDETGNGILTVERVTRAQVKQILEKVETNCYGVSCLSVEETELNEEVPQPPVIEQRIEEQSQVTVATHNRWVLSSLLGQVLKKWTGQRHS